MKQLEMRHERYCPKPAPQPRNTFVGNRQLWICPECQATTLKLTQGAN